LLIILGCCILVGLIAVLGFYAAYYKLLVEPYSLTPVLFVPEGMFECLSILVMFFGVLQVSVYYALQRIEIIDDSEDNII